MINLGVLASGRGSNFQAIIDAVARGVLPAKIKVLVTDNSEAYAIERARRAGIPWHYFDPKSFKNKEEYEKEIVKTLLSYEVDTVCLAGYMRLIGKPLLSSFPMRIINIHPALLPAFPGLHAQKQALDYGVKIAGCTVHFVDEGMDTGPIILQAAVPVYDDDSEESLSERILEQEHRILVEALRLLSENRLVVEGRRVRILPDGREGHGK
ncbi:phosphoribosylglycinamide formyltransferase [Carboxydothermus islandicus]|uniref:Phosphoribosylglycinamide formyltransferase n=1 Tax=Carboxydothermus islandicus TaxID=661089 RepID=A0A1L8D588_9THEO|nr:phosphoribosylglycinamide formyltransferase [Carboxydothermus islandicus]GAV26241.1 phosphoribosylglycinamide formyltransferase [Carboxydothermus islandicus]